MTAKELIEYLKTFPGDAEVFVVGWNGLATVKRVGQTCCNIQHQQLVKEVWISNEGLIVNSV